jgi:ligand-binding SRPBCC domain-containing protein
MAFYTLNFEQRIPTDLDTAWEFISRPENLKTITPDYMGFDILTTDLPEVMYPGLIIEYRVRPVARLPMRWVTEITHIREKQYFVDEQRIGPYAMWHHEHIVEPIDGGVLMRDKISYAPPLGPLGQIAHALFIRRQLQSVFDYREQALIDTFGAFPGS